MSKFHPDKDNGKIIRSIYSPGWQGTRIPEGNPGRQRPLVQGDELRVLMASDPDATRWALREAARKAGTAPVYGLGGGRS